MGQFLFPFQCLRGRKHLALSPASVSLLLSLATQIVFLQGKERKHSLPWGFPRSLNSVSGFVVVFMFCPVSVSLWKILYMLKSLSPPPHVSAVTLSDLTPSFSLPLRKDAKLDAVLRLWRLRQENPCPPFETVSRTCEIAGGDIDSAPFALSHKCWDSQCTAIRVCEVPGLSQGLQASQASN